MLAPLSRLLLDLHPALLLLLLLDFLLLILLLTLFVVSGSLFVMLFVVLRAMEIGVARRRGGAQDLHGLEVMLSGEGWLGAAQGGLLAGLPTGLWQGCGGRSRATA